MKKNNGFTLIELLVVIAIIALLLAIIIPSLRKAKEHALFLICKSNLKAYGVGMVTYLSENNDCFTQSFAGVFSGTSTSSHQWHDKTLSPWYDLDNAGPLWPYLENPKIHLCPTFLNVAKLTHYPCPLGLPFDPQFSYSQNNFLGWDKGVLKSAEVKDPGNTLVFVEETMWTIPDLATHILNDTCFMSRHPRDPFGMVGDCIATYHNTPAGEVRRNDGSGNGIFLDGHVDLSKPDRIEVNGLYFGTSFILIWPKVGTYSTTCPY